MSAILRHFHRFANVIQYRHQPHEDIPWTTASRRDKLRKLLKKTGVDALLVTNFTNVTYLTGFTGDDSYLLVRRDGEIVLSDPALHHPDWARNARAWICTSARRA